MFGKAFGICFPIGLAIDRVNLVPWLVLPRPFAWD